MLIFGPEIVDDAPSLCSGSTNITGEWPNHFLKQRITLNAMCREVLTGKCSSGLDAVRRDRLPQVIDWVKCSGQL